MSSMHMEVIAVNETLFEVIYSQEKSDLSAQRLFVGGLKNFQKKSENQYQ